MQIFLRKALFQLLCMHTSYDTSICIAASLSLTVDWGSILCDCCLLPREKGLALKVLVLCHDRILLDYYSTLLQLLCCAVPNGAFRQHKCICNWYIHIYGWICLSLVLKESVDIYDPFQFFDIFTHHIYFPHTFLVNPIDRFSLFLSLCLSIPLSLFLFVLFNV